MAVPGGAPTAAPTADFTNTVSVYFFSSTPIQVDKFTLWQGLLLPMVPLVVIAVIWLRCINRCRAQTKGEWGLHEGDDGQDNWISVTNVNRGHPALQNHNRRNPLHTRRSTIDTYREADFDDAPAERVGVDSMRKHPIFGAMLRALTDGRNLMALMVETFHPADHKAKERIFLYSSMGGSSREEANRKIFLFRPLDRPGYPAAQRVFDGHVGAGGLPIMDFRVVPVGQSTVEQLRDRITTDDGKGGRAVLNVDVLSFLQQLAWSEAQVDWHEDESIRIITRAENQGLVVEFRAAFATHPDGTVNSEGLAVIVEWKQESERRRFSHEPAPHERNRGFTDDPSAHARGFFEEQGERRRGASDGQQERKVAWRG